MTLPAAVCAPLADIPSLPGQALHLLSTISEVYFVHQSQVVSGRHSASVQPEALRRVMRWTQRVGQEHSVIIQIIGHRYKNVGFIITSFVSLVV